MTTLTMLLPYSISYYRVKGLEPIRFPYGTNLPDEKKRMHFVNMVLTGDHQKPIVITNESGTGERDDRHTVDLLDVRDLLFLASSYFRDAHSKRDHDAFGNYNYVIDMICQAIDASILLYEGHVLPPISEAGERGLHAVSLNDKLQVALDALNDIVNADEDLLKYCDVSINRIRDEALSLKRNIDKRKEETENVDKS